MEDGGQRFGNMEPYLAYQKLHRTGRLLRSLHAKATTNEIILYSTSPYARAHNEGVGGGGGNPHTKKTKGGATDVWLGTSPRKRPFMNPSKAVLYDPLNRVKKKMRSFGW